MSKPLTIGLVVPFSTDKVPEEGPMMYPGVKFIPRAVGVRALTPEGYDAAWNGSCRPRSNSRRRASTPSW